MMSTILMLIAAFLDFIALILLISLFSIKDNLKFYKLLRKASMFVYAAFVMSIIAIINNAHDIIN